MIFICLSPSALQRAVGLVVALLVEASLLYELADTVDFVCPSNVSQTKVVKIKHM